VDFSAHHWNYVSNEAKSLAAMMVARDEKNRCTVAEALQHPWFTLAHNNTGNLLNALDNMKKYKESDRFDVSKIKPEFSMITCTPLLKGRFTGQDSPLLRPVHGRVMGIKSRFFTPKPRARTSHKVLQAKTKFKNFVVINDDVLNTSGNFDERDIDENLGEEKSEKMNHCEFVVRKSSKRVAPPISGSVARNSVKFPNNILRSIQKSREFKSDNGKYLKKITDAKLNEETKTLPGPKSSQEVCNSEASCIRPSKFFQPDKVNSSHLGFPLSTKRRCSDRKPKKLMTSVKLLSKYLLES